MNKAFRLIISILVVLGAGLLAHHQAAWAITPTGAAHPSEAESVSSAPLQGKNDDNGTVKPPPAQLRACEDGIYSVGGVSTLNVNNLAPGYCLVAFLRNHAFALGRIPNGAGEVLAHITFLRVFYRSRFVYELPIEDGQAEICYAVPPGKDAQIYFFDFYGPRFGERTGQPSWEPLTTTVEDGIACAPAQISGAYALIGD